MWPLPDLLWLNFSFLLVVPLVINLLAKFEVSSSNRSRDVEGIECVPKFQKQVTWLLPYPLWPNFAFLSLVPLVVNMHAKFEVSSSTRSRYIEGAQNSKSRSLDPFTTCRRIWIPRPRFAYSIYNLHVATMTIKGSLQVSIAIVKTFFQPIFDPKFGWVSWPLNRVTPMTPYMDSLISICLLTTQLTWGYDDD